MRLFLLLLVFLAPVSTSTVQAADIPECKGPLTPSLPGLCDGVGFEGCCDALGRVLYCEDGDLYCIDCAGTFEHCGWNGGGYYDCGQDEDAADPSGAHPYACAEPCEPACPEGAFCLADGTCHVPQCGTKQCGTDPLGFSCGVCPPSTACVEGSYQCLALPAACVPQAGPGCAGCGCEACVCEVFPFCCSVKWDIFCAEACVDLCAYDCSPCPPEPSCAGVECGEVCGLDCGGCPPGATCFQGQCCEPQCQDKECGSDGCGGACGACGAGDMCQAGQCVPCVPQCQGKECGPDGCGGECGTCPVGASCNGGACVSGSSCNGRCGSQAPGGCYCDELCIDYGDCCADVCDWCPEICEPDECDACAEGEVCDPEGHCCAPDCGDRVCGDDGCGGSCGSCSWDEKCEAGACVPGDCEGIPWQGCCSAGMLAWCEQGVLDMQSCASDPDCGWNGAEGYYDCGTKGSSDPAGVFPLDCAVYCVPDCTGLACGDDGCGGSCGSCEEGSVCLEGACTADPCGGIDFTGCCDGTTLRWCQDHVLFEKDCSQMTGACGWKETSAEYNCGTGGDEDPSGAHPKPCPGSCVPACEGRDCGEDGCGGSCGACADGELCVDGACTLPPPEPGPETGEPDAGAPDATAGEAAGDALAEPSAPPAKGSGGCAAAPGPAFPALLLLFLPFLALRVRPRMPSVLALFLLSCSPPSGTDPGPDTVAPVDQVAEDTRIPEDLLPDLPPDLPEDQVPDSPPDVPSELPPPEDTPPPDTAPDVPEPPLVDCDALPEGPFELEKVPGAIASEDLAFDGLGHLVGSDNQAIYKSTAGGQVSLLAPDVHFRAGMRYLPNGLLAVNDNNQGRVLVVYPDGSVTVLLGGLSYPNGMTVDTLGFIYVTEHDASRVLRIHSYTGEYTVLTDEIWNPNGITFNTTYDTLYIGSFGMAAIFALSISPDGVPGRLETWADFSDTPGLLDGMGVDACGNVYVCEYGATDVWRVSADGKTKKKIIIGGPYDTYLPNFQWGRGPGWDPESIYLPDGWKIGVWRARVGVPSAPLAFPPGG